MSQRQATEALAAYIGVRRSIAPGAAVQQIPAAMPHVPKLADLVKVLDGFVGANAQGGAAGMALVAAAHRAAGFDAALPSRNDPRRIDIAIKRGSTTVIGAEVKQVDTTEATADSLAKDAADANVSRALLAVLNPGSLIDFDRTAVIRRAEKDHDVVLRVAHGSRELLHEVISAGDVAVSDFCVGLPRLFAEALRDIRVSEQTIAAWAAIVTRWQA